MKALQMAKYGAPQEVVELVDLPEPEAPKADEVLAAVEYAPINHSESPKILEAMKLGARLVAEGKLRVPIAATYPLASAATALAHAEKGGKVLFAAA
jgi:NADPH:quinone reductase-like Zn-dependent oxidoreductase